PEPVMNATLNPHVSISLALNPSNTPGLRRMDGDAISFRSCCPGFDARPESCAVTWPSRASMLGLFAWLVPAGHSRMTFKFSAGPSPAVPALECHDRAEHGRGSSLDIAFRDGAGRASDGARHGRRMAWPRLSRHREFVCMLRLGTVGSHHARRG